MSEPFGPTGHFPDGKLNRHDEGQLQFGVTNDDGKVILNFAKPVAWIGMNPQDAANLAAILITHARLAAKKAGITFTLNVSLGRHDFER